MQLFEGLLFYEIVLLALGVLLFLVLLFLLVYSIIKKRDIKILALFFVISIIMIGYPSIQKIKFDNGVVEIEKKTQLVEQNPADSAAQVELRKTLSEIEQRPISEPQTLTSIARAQAAIGDTVKALNYVDTALKEAPASPEAVRLQEQLSTPRIKVEKNISMLQENPNNPTVRSELKKDLALLEKSPAMSASNYLTRAKAHAILGDTAQSSVLVDSALHYKPHNPAALQLKKALPNAVLKTERHQ